VVPRFAVDVVLHLKLYFILLEQMLFCCNPQAHIGALLLKFVGALLNSAVILMSLLLGTITGPMNALGNQDPQILILP
jgi:hypothetical protein